MGHLFSLPHFKNRLFALLSQHLCDSTHSFSPIQLSGLIHLFFFFLSSTMTDTTRQRTDLKVLTTEYLSTAQTAVAQVRQKASHMVTSAKSLMPQVSVPPLDALSTVMFSPLAAHPVYRSESMMRAMQIMQQQQRGSTTSTAIARPRSDLVLHGTSYAWPSSVALLEEDIPESNEPVSLFQGFAATYPSLAKPKKRSRQRKRKMASDSSSVYSQERKEGEA